MNDWVKHVKAYQKKHGGTYANALKNAGKTYRKKKKGGADLLLDPERMKRKEQSGEDFLANLESRVQNKEGAYGDERLQGVYAKGKRRSARATPKPVETKQSCDIQEKSFVKSHCRKKRR
jgi:hypothetical protein